MNKSKIYFHSILLFFLFSNCLFAQTKQYKFRHITSNQGLSAPSIYSIVRDNQGFMWFASGLGLFRYDGYNVQAYRCSPSDINSLSSNLITGQLFVDYAGNLWIGTKDNGLNHFNIATETAVQYQHNPLDSNSLSNNNVHRIIQDKPGNIWVATQGGGLNRLNDDKQSFSAFLPEPDNISSEANFIQCLIELDDVSFLVGTRKGLYVFNRLTHSFRPFANEKNSLDELNEEVITDIIEDGNIFWIGTENGLVKYNRKNESVLKFTANENDKTSLSSNMIRQIVNSPDNKSLWISTIWGLNNFNKHTHKSERFLYSSDDPNSLGFNMLWGMYIDHDNLLWIGTDNGGVNVLNLNKNPFHHHKLGGLSDGDEQFSATVFCEVEQGDFWIGSFEGGLWNYDHEMKIKKHFFNLPNTPKFLAENSIFSLCEDSDGQMWVGTSNGGVNILNKHELVSMIIEPVNSQKAPTSVIEIIEDRKRIIWLGTLNGLYYFDKNSGNSIENIGLSPLNDALIRSICVDQNENMWIGTHSEGLFKISHGGKGERLVTNYRNNPKEPGSINSDIVMSVYEDHAGNVWIATTEGLNRYIHGQDSFESFDEKNGLDADYLYHIQGGDSGALWITSSGGLLRFDPQSASNQRSRLFEIQRNVQFEDIYPYSFYRRKNGEICVGGKRGSNFGYYTFHPDSLRDNTSIPEIAVTVFKVRNENYELDSAIISQKNIRLTHDQNFFSFEFVALDFTNSQQNQYAYMLEGFDDGWNYSDTRHFANYTGVPPGNYIFRVKGSNNDGYWNEEGASIHISILTPPWKTWWAYLLYLLAALSIVFSMFYYYFRRQHLLHALELEQVESEKLKELDSMKAQFFANISHEFRTPLTLILGPLKKLLSTVSNRSDNQELSIAHKHASRLKILINDILTISKLEAGKMELLAAEINIVGLLRTYISAFESLGKQKNIDLKLNHENEEIRVFLDQVKFEKVLNNLFSNAFKFTDEGGKITVSVSMQNLAGGFLNGSLQIQVSNTGDGIPREHLKHVFDRFYQVEKNDSNYYHGTGIGLALTKELVDLHYGTIHVESAADNRLNRKITTFTILLPLGKDHLKPEEIEEKKPEEIIAQPSESVLLISKVEESHVPSYASVQDKSLPILLIVEDNADMRSYIGGYFKNEFQILEAADGVIGFEKSIETIPDIIISDIMMPNMDGNVFCRKVKTDERTSHIPVIILTALASMESRIEGFEAGVDDFITKPFDGEELKLRVKNLLQQRKKLTGLLEKKIRKSHYTVHIDFSDSGVTSMDEQFLQKTYTIVKKHHTDPEFTVEEFCRSVGVSRVQLHRKIKALTGQNSSEFIRNYRLNHAAELIRKKSATIAEIAYTVGFNSPSYFTSCFSELFGILPSEFAEQNEGD